MALIRANTSGGGGGLNVYHATSIPSSGRVDLGFSPKYISVTGYSSQLYNNVWEDSDASHFTQYWGSSAYPYDVTSGGSGHAYTNVDSTGFNYDTGYTNNIREVVAYG